MFELTILGNSAATPAHDRHPSSQLLSFTHNRFLIDCGEGTQMQCLRFHVKINKINHIMISHLHGDHYLGLIGLLSSMHLQKRAEDINLFGPRELGEIIRISLKHSQTRFNYKVNFFEVPHDISEVVFEDNQITVESIPLEHRIKCSGYLFKEKPKKRKIIKDKLPEKIPVNFYKTLKEGNDILDENGDVLYKVEDYTQRGKSYSFAYCSDTRYSERIIPLIQHVDMLYHEATFMEEEADKAELTFHSTAQQAATIALKAGVNKLILGHFSSRYKTLRPLLYESRAIFANSHLGLEGHIYKPDKEGETLLDEEEE